MKARLLSLGAALALTLGLFTATPATATVAVQSITFPGDFSEFYSPFSGPASITFTFDGTEADATFSLRIRPAGGAAVHTQDVLVDADDPDGFQTKTFSWPALSVSSSKTYVVAVYRNGTQVASESFLLQPRLVTITSVAPNPFLPLIDDGYKDTTRVKFDLVTGADAEARVYRANTSGKCCGIMVRNDSTGLHGLSAGPNEWVWDGKNNSSLEAGVGVYFVKIWADDGVVAPAVSKPFKVSIARTYRKLATLQKDGILMHHTGQVTSYRRGGNCFVTKDETDRDLWITCLSASFKVYWRWALPTGGRIEGASFVYVHVSSEICNGKKGFTTTDSFLKVGGVGQFRCRVDTAKVTYSRPVAS
jgi:hypothetical protein